MGLININTEERGLYPKMKIGEQAIYLARKISLKFFFGRKVDLGKIEEIFPKENLNKYPKNKSP